MRGASGLLELWKAEEELPFSGWDFSYLDGRILLDQPPWSYTARAKKLMRRASSVLDIATGGGKRLLEMQDSLPGKVVATEGHPHPKAPRATQLPGTSRVCCVRLAAGKEGGSFSPLEKPGIILDEPRGPEGPCPDAG